MKNVINSLENKNVFKKQLNLSLKELRNYDSYPKHWDVFIDFLIKKY